MLPACRSNPAPRPFCFIPSLALCSSTEHHSIFLLPQDSVCNSRRHKGPPRAAELQFFYRNCETGRRLQPFIQSYSSRNSSTVRSSIARTRKSISRGTLFHAPHCSYFCLPITPLPEQTLKTRVWTFCPQKRTYSNKVSPTPTTSASDHLTLSLRSHQPHSSLLVSPWHSRVPFPVFNNGCLTTSTKKQLFFVTTAGPLHAMDLSVSVLALALLQSISQTPH